MQRCELVFCSLFTWRRRIHEVYFVYVEEKLCDTRMYEEVVDYCKINTNILYSSVVCFRSYGASGGLK